ncbi:hypothetical protein FOZ60_011966 [Perkinsus olseni]|uniref:Integrase catalytic domain-containing protein n=1 Tax=Perkinsus olseni TaxID=32597 RepID=A0A7J6NDL3_PEROL|nr:hypothetical protein FOZ60_011966 [Perkinsus olseni]
MVDGLYHGPDGVPYTFMLTVQDEQQRPSDSCPASVPALVRSMLPEVASLQRQDSKTTYQGIPIKYLLQAGDHLADGHTLDSFEADSTKTTVTVRNWFEAGAFSMVDNVLYRNYQSDKLDYLVIFAPVGGDFRSTLSDTVQDTCDGPLSFRSLLCYLAHGDVHLGAPACLANIQSFSWWPNMNKYVKDYIHYCSFCRTGRNRNRAPLVQPITGCRIPENRSLLHIAVDYADPPIESKLIHVPGEGQVSAILVVCDLFTGYTQYYPAVDKSALTCAYLLYTRWCTFAGLPSSVTSDNSPFNAEVWSSLCSFAGVSARRITPHHPQSNGACERRVHACKVAISHNPNLRWDLALPLVSAALLFGRRPYRPLDLVFHSTMTATESREDFGLHTLEDPEEALRWFRVLGADIVDATYRHYLSVIERRHNESDRANAGPKPISPFSPGDRVLWVRPSDKQFSTLEGSVVRDAGVPDVDDEKPDESTFQGRYQRGHSYLVKFDDGACKVVHSSQLRFRRAMPAEETMVQPQLRVDQEALMRLDLQVGDHCAAVLQGLPQSTFMIGKVVSIEGSSDGEIQVHVLDRPAGEKRFYPMWHYADGSIRPSSRRPRGATPHIKNVTRLLTPSFSLTPTSLLPKQVEARLSTLGLSVAIPTSLPTA